MGQCRSRDRHAVGFCIKNRSPALLARHSGLMLKCNSFNTLHFIVGTSLVLFQAMLVFSARIHVHQR